MERSKARGGKRKYSIRAERLAALLTATVSCDQALPTSPRQITRIRHVSTAPARRRRADRCAADGGLRGRREWWRYGFTDAGAMSRIERQVRRELAFMTDRVQAVARTVASDPTVPTEHGAERRGPSARVVRRRGARAQSIAGRSTSACRHDLRLVGRRAGLGRPPVGPPPGADRRRRRPCS